MSKSKAPWLLALLIALAFAWWMQRRSLHVDSIVLTGEHDPASLPVDATDGSGSDEQATLVFDGRRNGRSHRTLPYAWLPPGDAASQLYLTLATPTPIAGVVVSWAGAAPKQTHLRVGTDASREQLPAANLEAETTFWLATERSVTRIALELASRAPQTGVAEIGVLPANAPTWLISPRARADWDLETLGTYGYPNTPRLPVDADLQPALRRARALVVSNASLPPQTRTQLRSYVEGGGLLVELGPKPAVCGPSTTSEHPSEGGFVLDEALGGSARWFSSIARLASCDPSEPACANPRTLVNARRTATDEAVPLVVTYAHGRGRCTRWLGDLTAALRDLRQGTPALASKHDPADGPFKPADLFVGRLDRADFDVPSADRLGFLLAAELTRAPGLDLVVSPLPAAAPALVILTIDQDFVPAAGELAHSNATLGAGVTVLLTAADIGGDPDVIYPEARAPMLELDDVNELATRGHSVGIHPNLVGVDPQEHGRVIAEHVQRFRKLYDVAPRIVRNHHLVWSGYLEMAEHMARAGLRLDLDYVSTHRSGSMPPGFMTGSGLPMRFVDERGRLLPLWQQATQLDDSSLIVQTDTELQLASSNLRARMRALLDIASREHVPVTVLHHSHWWFRDAGVFQSDLLSQARSRDIPVWGAAEWLRFTQGRLATEVRRRDVGFEVTVRTVGLTLLVEGTSTLRVDGRSTKLDRALELGGTRFFLLPLPPGTFVLTP